MRRLKRSWKMAYMESGIKQFVIVKSDRQNDKTEKNKYTVDKCMNYP